MQAYSVFAVFLVSLIELLNCWFLIATCNLAKNPWFMVYLKPNYSLGIGEWDKQRKTGLQRDPPRFWNGLFCKKPPFPSNQLRPWFSQIDPRGTCMAQSSRASTNALSHWIFQPSSLGEERSLHSGKSVTHKSGKSVTHKQSGKFLCLPQTRSPLVPE